MAEHKDLTGSDLHEPKGIDAVTTLEHMIYEADGAGGGSWKYQSNGVHAEMLIQSNTTAEVVPTAVDGTLNTDSDYVKLATGWSAGHLHNVAFSTDKLTIQIAGSYELHSWVDISLPSNNQLVAIKYAINETTPYSTRKLITNSSSAGDIVNMAGSGIILSLGVGDTVSLAIATDLAGDPTILEGGVLLKLLDEA